MANKSLLDSVNAVLKRADLIQGSDGELASLTDSARQPWVDIAVQIINEGIDELYDKAEMPLPEVAVEGTITLADGDRDYALPENMAKIFWPLHDRTNGKFITEYKGGYKCMVEDQLIPTNYTGLPHEGAIRPTDGEMYLDRLPTSAEVGKIYTFLYIKDTLLDAAAETVPFENTVFRAMVPAWAQLFNRDWRNDFDEGIYLLSVGRAARLLTKQPMRRDYDNTTDLVFADAPPGI